MTTTSSDIRQNFEPENHALCRKWCDEAAALGGTFSVTSSYHDGHWHTKYTINWPDIRRADPNLFALKA